MHPPTTLGAHRRPRRALPIAMAVTMVWAAAFVVATRAADEAGASHFRANQTTWVRTAPDTVEITIINAYRGDYFSITGVGDTFSEPVINFGDGTNARPTFEVIGYDAANDIATGRAVVSHTYADPSQQYWLVQNDCCRLSSSNGHVNNPDGYQHQRTLVDLSVPSSPSSTISPIVGCPTDAECRFTVPAAANGAGTIAYRLAENTADMNNTGFDQPAGASIDATTGLYSWDTTGATLNSDPDGPTYYSTQVIIETHDASGEPTGSIAVDFFIQIGGANSNQPPTFVAPTPADATVIEVLVDAEFVLPFAAEDVDEDHIQLGVLNQPTGAVFTQNTDDHGSATGTFTWTPDALGDTYIILTAVDSNGLSATQRTVTLRVVDELTEPEDPETPGPEDPETPDLEEPEVSLPGSPDEPNGGDPGATPADGAGSPGHNAPAATPVSGSPNYTG